jgi:hypothetical protein
MLTRLQEYANKYSVYNDALNSSQYIKRYAKSDIFPSQDKTLIYAQKIVSNNKNIGVLCLCFKYATKVIPINNELNSNTRDNKNLLNEQLKLII